MKDYKVESASAVYRDTIQVTETTDTNHADNINYAPKQIYENTVANRRDIETLQNATTTWQQPFAIPVTGWAAYESTGYLYCDIAVEGVNADMIPTLTIDKAYEEIAGDCGIKGETDTLEGFLRVYADEAPERAIPATLTLQGAVGTGGRAIATDEQADVAIEDLLNRHRSGNGGENDD